MAVVEGVLKLAPSCRVPPLKLNVAAPRPVPPLAVSDSPKSRSVPPLRFTTPFTPAWKARFSWLMFTKAVPLMLSVATPVPTPKKKTSAPSEKVPPLTFIVAAPLPLATLI